MEKLQHRCMELEGQLAAERGRKDDQLSDVQQRQIDDILVKYKERMKTIEDDKMAVRYTLLASNASQQKGPASSNIDIFKMSSLHSLQ